MGKTKRRRTQGIGNARDQRRFRHQREDETMSGIIDLTVGPSWDESVHERWDTGSPSDWRVDSLGDVYEHLVGLNAAESLGYAMDDIWDDANLIWDWIESARMAKG